MSGFTRTFLLPLTSPLLKTEKKGISSQVALLSDDVNRRIYLKQEGRRHLQQIQTRTDSGWDFLDVQLTKRQYHQLLPQVRERKLNFAVYAVKTGNPSGYIRDFQGELSGLKMLSVNFRDAATAHSWTPDAEFLLGPEVTYHRNFGDYALITDSNGAKDVPTETIHKKNNFVVGVIPYFPLSSGVELVIVQTRKKRRLIFPKGQPENDLSDKYSTTEQHKQTEHTTEKTTYAKCLHIANQQYPLFMKGGLKMADDPIQGGPTAVATKYDGEEILRRALGWDIHQGQVGHVTWVLRGP